MRLFDAPSEDIEKRFLDAVSRGPRRLALGRLQTAASRRARDDAHDFTSKLRIAFHILSHFLRFVNRTML